MTSLWNWHLEM